MELRLVDESRLNEVVNTVCRLPLDFKLGNARAVDLLSRSGYLEVRRDVTPELIADRLAMDPELIDAWILWSEDDRASRTWLIEAVGPSEFEVGYYDNGMTRQRRFTDKVQACAVYVHHQLEQIAEHSDLPRFALASMKRALAKHLRI